MEKIKILTFACFIILGLAACADDENNNNSSSNTLPVINTDEIVFDNFTVEIGKEAVKTVTFTNPHAAEADLEVNYYNSDPSIIIDMASSTCDNVTNMLITSRLAPGQSCEIKYTYKPTQLDTKRLNFRINYTRTFESVCPTPNTVPTIEQLITNNKYVDMYIDNYAKNSTGNISPDYINVQMNPEWAAGGAPVNIISHSQTFNMPAKKGDYSFYSSPYQITSNNSNCTISNGTLTVNNDNGCSLTITASYQSQSTISFTPKQAENPYYNISIDFEPEYYYTVIDPSYGNNTLETEYNSLFSDNYKYVGLLQNGEKITSYEFTGTYANKFKAAGTAHNSCTVTDTEISIPAGQQTCFFTVEIADISVNGSFDSVLNTALNTGTTRTYPVSGSVSNITLDFYLQNVCKMSM